MGDKIIMNIDGKIKEINANSFDHKTTKDLAKRLQVQMDIGFAASILTKQYNVGNIVFRLGNLMVGKKCNVREDGEYLLADVYYKLGGEFERLRSHGEVDEENNEVKVVAKIRKTDIFKIVLYEDPFLNI